MQGRLTILALIAWSAVMAVYYWRTIADNCGAGEGDCGAAIGLGLLLSAMIWGLGAGVIALVSALVGTIAGWLARRDR